MNRWAADNSNYLTILHLSPLVINREIEMDKATGNIEWEMVFENKTFDNVATNSEIASLVNKAMDAWHKVIEDYSRHSNEGCRAPYIHNERTTSGLFATSITKYVDDGDSGSGSVLTEFPGHKKNIAAGGRIDIEWITQDNRNWIIFESKQERHNIEDGTIEKITGAFFKDKHGLLAQSARDFDKYHEFKRFSNKSHDDYYHVGLLFCPVKLNNSIVNTDIMDIFEKLKSNVPCRLLDEKGKFEEKLSNIDFGRLYSCVYLCRPYDQNDYSLITAAIVFRSP